MNSFKDRLVDDWRDLLKWASVQWALLGTVVLPFLQFAPSSLPADVQAMLPPSVRATITGLWCIGFVVLRVWQQKQSG